MLKTADEIAQVGVIRTGLFLDKLSGIGGIPKGHITEIFGDPGVGKSTLCLQIVAEAQKEKIPCLWVDIEYSFSSRYAQELGVDTKKLLILRARFAEQALEEVERQIDSGKFGLIVIDSIGGLTPRAEVEKGIDGKIIGAQANLVARFCRKVVPTISMNNIALVVINHSVVDIMSGKIMSSGGKKLAYHKSLSIRLRQKTGFILKRGDSQIGKVIKAQVWGKNRLAATEGVEVESNFIFGHGFSAVADLFQDAVDSGVITKVGQSFYFQGEKLGRGIGAARDFVTSNAEIRGKISDSVEKSR